MYVCMYVCMYACMYVCICMHMYIYMYIYIYMHFDFDDCGYHMAIDDCWKPRTSIALSSRRTGDDAETTIYIHIIPFLYISIAGFSIRGKGLLNHLSNLSESLEISESCLFHRTPNPETPPHSCRRHICLRHLPIARAGVHLGT